MNRAAAMVVLVMCIGSAAVGTPRNPDTDWFRDAGYGVFAHFLWDVQCVGDRPNTQGKAGTTSWDACVAAFDVERFAEQMKQAQAGYVIFTMMQRTRYLIAPNATYDRLTGYPPGQACSTRDLVEDLYQALKKRGIPLMLYWTGDGPRQDEQAARGMGGWDGKVSDVYVQNWAFVAAEYSKRYGKKVRGWWVDGCYEYIGYNEKRWGILAAGLKAGNPRAIIALNNPSLRTAGSSSDHDDFTTGEVNAFTDVPQDRWRDGKQFHVLSFLGDQWCGFGCRYDLAYMTDYVARVMAAEGVVSIDVGLYRDGSIDAGQLELLRQLRPAVMQRLAEK